MKLTLFLKSKYYRSYLNPWETRQTYGTEGVVWSFSFHLLSQDKPRLSECYRAVGRTEWYWAFGGGEKSSSSSTVVDFCFFLFSFYYRTHTLALSYCAHKKWNSCDLHMLRTASRLYIFPYYTPYIKRALYTRESAFTSAATAVWQLPATTTEVWATPPTCS